METIKDKTLVDVLSYCDLRELPKEDTKEFVWLKAVGLIVKSDGTENYSLLVKDKNGKPKIKKDFGSVASVVKIKKTYPFALLDEKYVPTFKTKTKEERIEWLCKMGSTEDLNEYSLKELDKMVLNMAIQNALKTFN
jgi:hypothetical protein